MRNQNNSISLITIINYQINQTKISFRAMLVNIFICLKILMNIEAYLMYSIFGQTKNGVKIFFRIYLAFDRINTSNCFFDECESNKIDTILFANINLFLT